LHGARMPRHVRSRLPRQSRPEADPAVRGLRGASAAQGLSEDARAAAGLLPKVTRAPLDTRVETSLPNPLRPAFGRGERDDSVVVSSGPSHPATHGTVQIIAALDGERVERVDVHPGYLHRGFEKECEDHTWHNLIPYVDRLNYVSGLVNNFAYCEAV